MLFAADIEIVFDSEISMGCYLQQTKKRYLTQLTTTLLLQRLLSLGLQCDDFVKWVKVLLNGVENCVVNNGVFYKNLILLYETFSRGNREDVDFIYDQYL